MRSPNQMIMTAAGRLHGALTDPARRERSVVLLLVAYAVAWTAYGTIAKSSQGLHFDMVEVIAWSRDLAFGYLKHPPLAAWLVRGWFSVFPLTEASYYLLAMLMPALALWIVWRLSADYLEIEKRIFALALLTLVPFYNFQALKFNVNTVLLPLWAATTLWFLRSYRTRSALYAALAGIGAAGSMLGKYWSVFLLAGLALAALIDRRRGVYFRSAAPWITAAAGGIVLAPHLVWLVRHHFAPFAYAIGIHGDKPFATALHGVAGYLVGAIGYVALPAIVVLAIARPGRAALADMIWPKENERRLVAAAFWGPLLLPVIGALVSGSEINSLWSMPAWTLLPLLLLSSPAVTLAPIDTRRLLAGATLLPLVMLIAAPFIAVANQRAGITAPSAQSALLAAEIERLWHQATPQPLRFVGGDAGISYGVVAYAVDRPRALPEMPAPDAADLARSGWVLVCDAQSTGCVASAAARAAADTASRQVITDIVRNFFGFPGKLLRYTIFIVPPQP
jgi:4-amino-4-deoxy-L-arabinose transferase-like glycosyltransferase